MRQVRVKICGITSPKDVAMVSEAGADALGFIVDVPDSPRNLSVDEAKNLIKRTPIFVETVAVTVTQDISHLEKIHKELNSSTIQVHGLEYPYNEIRERLNDARLIGVIQAQSDLAFDIAKEGAATFDAILLDSNVSGSHGGTGRTHNWEISRHIREAVQPKPLILAGGLRPDNVEEAIRKVKPYAVDVSSGVELSPGVKDRRKVIEFVKNAKEVEI